MSAELKHRGVAVAEERWRRKGGARGGKRGGDAKGREGRRGGGRMIGRERNGWKMHQ